MVMPSLDTSIANAGLPTVAQAFSASFPLVQWIVLAYLLALTTLLLSVGRLGDLIGRQRLLLAGIDVFTVASFLCGVAPTLWILIAARAAQGLGAAIMLALTVSFVGQTVLGGVLIAGCDWRTIFLVKVPLGLLTVLLAQRSLPVDRRGPSADRAGFDTVGAVLLALTLAAYTLAVTIGRGQVGPLTIALLCAAAGGVGLFVRAETRTASPLIRLAPFCDPVLRASLAMSTLVATV